MSPSDPRRKQAVALRYRSTEESAPRVVARGEGGLAERILALALEHGVPVREDGDLVALLGACELGHEIPEDLFRAVAELLVSLQAVNAELRGERA